MNDNDIKTFYGICTECSEIPYHVAVTVRTEDALIEEFGQLYHDTINYKVFCDNFNRILPEVPKSYPQTWARYKQEYSRRLKEDYFKKVVAIGFQDPYSFYLCADCLAKYSLALTRDNNEKTTTGNQPIHPTES